MEPWVELSRGDGSTGQMPQTLTGLLGQPPRGPGGREATLPNEQAPQEGSSGPRKTTVPCPPRDTAALGPSAWSSSDSSTGNRKCRVSWKPSPGPEGLCHPGGRTQAPRGSRGRRRTAASCPRSLGCRAEAEGQRAHGVDPAPLRPPRANAAVSLDSADGVRAPDGSCFAQGVLWFPFPASGSQPCPSPMGGAGRGRGAPFERGSCGQRSGGAV